MKYRKGNFIFRKRGTSGEIYNKKDNTTYFFGPYDKAVESWIKLQETLTIPRKFVKTGYKSYAVPLLAKEDNNPLNIIGKSYNERGIKKII